MNKPIGIFDSGIGGISFLDNLVKRFRYENFIYLADNKNCPYGNKSKNDIIRYSLKNSKKLLELDCKILVVACNTATTNSIEKIRELVSIPVIGIEPGLKPAIEFTKTKNIGVLATEKTLSSKLFFETSKTNQIKGLNIYEQIGFELVSMIEKDSYDYDEMFKILKSYLSPMINKNIDCLVLGCTHYNFIKNIIEDIVTKKIKIIDTIAPVNNHIHNTLNSNNIFNSKRRNRFIKVFYNGEILQKKYISNEYLVGYLNF